MVTTLTAPMLLFRFLNSSAFIGYVFRICFCVCFRLWRSSSSFRCSSLLVAMFVAFVVVVFGSQFLKKNKTPATNCHKLSKTVTNCQKLSQTVTNCQKPSKKKSKTIKNHQKQSKFGRCCHYPLCIFLFFKE